MVKSKRRPTTSPTAQAAEAERRARLAAALRANLSKRKSQKRGRDEAACQAGLDETGPDPRQPLEGGPKVK
jgi:hypothetical protein